MFLPARHVGIKILKSLALNSKLPFRGVGLHCRLLLRWKDGSLPRRCLSPLPCCSKPFAFIMRKTHGTWHSPALIRVYAMQFAVHYRKYSQPSHHVPALLQVVVASTCVCVQVMGYHFPGQNACTSLHSVPAAAFALREGSSVVSNEACGDL